MKEARIEVYGRVQGVRFRNSVRKFAVHYRLKGSVINLANGGVLIIAQGEKKNLERLILLIKRSPGFSKVEKVDVSWSDVSKSVRDFVIVREGNFFVDQLKSFSRLFKRIFSFSEEKIMNVPRHVAIIPDGNRRWAKKRGLEPHFGHYKSGSYANVELLLREAKRLGVKVFSIWGFSTENWKRSLNERRAIFDLLLGGIERFRKLAREERIRFLHVGRKDRLPRDLIMTLQKLDDDTRQFDDFTVPLCLDYGGRDEIIRTVNKILRSGVKKIDKARFARFLDTVGISDPDLIIRTSGEKRLSGFMPFQSAYSELYFSELYFPDFNVEELRKAILEYGRRQRRFGGG